MHLNPQETFTIVRQIEDHTDSGTYYVRAYVRNAKSDALLQTLNLTDRGSRRFSVDYQVPADVSGQGFFISIMTSVFTDSGYTTKSENYGDKMETYLVQDRQPFNPNYPLPTGQDIDYKKIKKIVKEVVEEELSSFEIPEAKVVTVTNTREVIKNIEYPKIDIPKIPSFKPILDAISDVYMAVNSIDIPQPKDVDLKPVNKSVDEVKVIVNDAFKSLTETINSKMSALKIEMPELELRVAEPKAVMSEKPIKPEIDERITRLIRTR